ncbi:MAG: PIN domain-containing protein [Verrucomicrobiota bacterium]
MLGIDTNLLFYSLNPESGFHARAERFLKASFSDVGETVVISDYVLVELYQLLRNEVVMAEPLSAGEAVGVVRSYLKIPNVSRAENARVMDRVWEFASRDGFARRRLFDMRLGLTLRHHGVTRFATANVKDFEGMGFSRVWNPLDTEDC